MLALLWKTALRKKIIFLFSLPLLLAFTLKNGLLTRQYLILPDSRLSILGSTNVAGFTCDCEQQFGKNSLSIEEVGQGRGKLKFHNTSLKIHTLKLDCRHKGINRDMYKTLEAEKHPYIHIVLKEAWPAGGKSLSSHGWNEMDARVAITVAGVTRDYTMKVKGKELVGESRYRFLADQELLMSDFKLEPPKPMLGLVKVYDYISIRMDLTVEII